MARTNLKNFGNTLTGIVKGRGAKSKKRFNKIVRRAGIKTFSNIIKITPVDTGRARGNWQIDTNLNNTELSGDVDINVNSEMPENVIGQKILLFNNLPYINTLEFGGYPKTPKSGSKTINGFSIQAPEGMVRINVRKWSAELKRAARAIK